MAWRGIGDKPLPEPMLTWFIDDSTGGGGGGGGGGDEFKVYSGRAHNVYTFDMSSFSRAAGGKIHFA